VPDLVGRDRTRSERRQRLERLLEARRLCEALGGADDLGRFAERDVGACAPTTLLDGEREHRVAPARQAPVGEIEDSELRAAGVTGLDRRRGLEQRLLIFGRLEEDREERRIDRARRLVAHAGDRAPLGLRATLLERGRERRPEVPRREVQDAVCDQHGAVRLARRVPEPRLDEAERIDAVEVAGAVPFLREPLLEHAVAASREPRALATEIQRRLESVGLVQRLETPVVGPEEVVDAPRVPHRVDHGEQVQLGPQLDEVRVRLEGVAQPSIGVLGSPVTGGRVGAPHREHVLGENGAVDRVEVDAREILGAHAVDRDVDGVAEEVDLTAQEGSRGDVGPGPTTGFPRIAESSATTRTWRRIPSARATRELAIGARLRHPPRARALARQGQDRRQEGLRRLGSLQVQPSGGCTRRPSS
jgi:hypothetical protein